MRPLDSSHAASPYPLPVVRILLVEDNAADADFIAALLGSGGGSPWRLERVSLVKAALERLLEQSFDVILLDLHLPDASGLEGLDALLAAAVEIPIVVLTGALAESYGPDAITRGAQDYLLKEELDARTLTRTIRHAIERQRILIELARTKADLERYAVQDPLTEMLNRRGLEQALQREIQRAARGGGAPAAILMDLDDFKRINDGYGHAAGDMVLRAVASVIRSGVRPADYAGRIGGDEFLILLPETRYNEALKIAERLRVAVAHCGLDAAGRPVRVTASFGVAGVPAGALSITEVLLQTQRALSRSKQTGKDRVAYAEEEGAPVEPPADDDGAEWIRTLSQADSFRVLSQPMVRLADGRTVACELLCRGPAGPLRMPAEFFLFSFEHKILTLVDLNCLRACLAAARALPPGLRPHVNLLPSTLLETPMDRLLPLLAGGVREEGLCVEIDEQQILGDPSALRALVARLREAGIVVALDDVGFGRSRLENLLMLEPDIVKVDKRLAAGIARDLAKAESLKRLLAMAAGLKATVIVEGIETEEDRDCLAGLGVEYGQGFLLGRPAPLAPPA